MPDSINVLVLFSNPIDSDRLRLDREDSIFVELVRQVREPVTVEVERKHAASFRDLMYLIDSDRFEIIHFSGHGTEDGILLEGIDGSGKGSIIDASQLVSLFDGLRPKRLRVLVFMSCFSSEMIGKLLNHSPYIISAEGAVPDDTALVFIRGFYSSYFLHRSVQRAFDDANLALSVESKLGNAGMTLTARNRFGLQDKLTIEAWMNRYPDVMLIDLSAVQESIAGLGMPQDEVLALLQRKIRVHSWIFAVPRDDAFLTIGASLIGNFSWNAKANIIRCNALYFVDDDVNPDHWKEWSRLLVIYNDLACEDYRVMDGPADRSQKRLFAKAIAHFKDAYQDFQSSVQILENLGYRKAEAAYKLAATYLKRAEQMYKEDDLSACGASLEATLSTLHSVIDSSVPNKAWLNSG